MSSTARPNASPCRRPSHRPASASARYRSGSAARTACTCPAVQGTTLRSGGFGARTLRAEQGLRTISPSSTAAFITIDNVVSTPAAVLAASGRPRTHAWIADGRAASWPTVRSPRAGYTCSRSRRSWLSRVASSNVCARSQPSAYRRSVTFPASGSR
jgi:hypothetical protein